MIKEKEKNDMFYTMKKLPIGRTLTRRGILD